MLGDAALPASDKLLADCCMFACVAFSYACLYGITSFDSDAVQRICRSSEGQHQRGVKKQ